MAKTGPPMTGNDFPRKHRPLLIKYKNDIMRKEKVTVQSAPFVKPHCVLIVAAATVLLINGRSPHTDVRSQKHAGMFSASRTLYG